MSIAMDEARRHIDYDDIPGPIVAWEDRDLAYAYIAGRTAEPTEAETEAAITEWDRHGYCHRVGTPIVCMCGARLTDEHSYDVHLVRAMLEAARKAVMGNE